jgi:hypothetical protein
MRITIHDEAERRAVLYALWRRAADLAPDDAFFSAAQDEADSALNPEDWDAPPGVFVSRQVTMIAATLLDVEQVREAKLGATVNLAGPCDAMREALEACVYTIVEDQAFWRSSQTDRDRRIANHDAAVRLASQLPKPAEAVA